MKTANNNLLSKYSKVIAFTVYLNILIKKTFLSFGTLSFCWFYDKILILSDYCPANYLFYRYLSLLRRLRSTFPKTWWKDEIRALDNVIIL